MNRCAGQVPHSMFLTCESMITLNISETSAISLSLAVSQAIDRPINTRKYIVEQLQRQAAVEARAKYEKNKTSNGQNEGPVEGDPMEEKDTLQDEEEYDMNTLLFPDGRHVYL